MFPTVEFVASMGRDGSRRMAMQLVEMVDRFNGAHPEHQIDLNISRKGTRRLKACRGVENGMMEIYASKVHDFALDFSKVIDVYDQGMMKLMLVRGVVAKSGSMIVSIMDEDHAKEQLGEIACSCGSTAESIFYVLEGDDGESEVCGLCCVNERLKWLRDEGVKIEHGMTMLSRLGEAACVVRFAYELECEPIPIDHARKEWCPESFDARIIIALIRESMGSYVGAGWASKAKHLVQAASYDVWFGSDIEGGPDISLGELRSAQPLAHALVEKLRGSIAEGSLDGFVRRFDRHLIDEFILSASMRKQAAACHDRIGSIMKLPKGV